VTRDEIVSGLEQALMAAGYAELAARRLVPYVRPVHLNAEAGTVTNPNYPAFGPSALGPAGDFIAVPPELMTALAELAAVSGKPCPEGCGGTVGGTGRHSADVDYCYALSQQAKADSGEPLD
jgi:hypothetical protein